MRFIEVEKSVREKEWSMTDLHSHSHYELYFLITGTRNFFIDNKMYKISAPCFTVIPPYTMHKTEGVGFSRININITENLLTPFESETLKKFSGKIVKMSMEDCKILFHVLEESVSVSESDQKQKTEKLKILTSYVIYQIGKKNLQSAFSPTTARTGEVSPLVLKLIDYINVNYNKSITLDYLSSIFYLSKASICAIFKKAMNCTVGEYLMTLKLNSVKQYLSSTKKSVEEISMLCGFSSSAYLGLIFKKKVGLSPLQFRKLQNSKQ